MGRGPIPDKPRNRPTVPEVVALASRYSKANGGWFGWALTRTQRLAVRRRL